MSASIHKIIAIGDLHGQDCWKAINPDEYDYILFLGDYVDSFSVPRETILSNLEDIIALKKLYPQKVTLLLGNHDIQYSEYPNYRCSGFDERMQPDYTQMFRENRHLFQVALQIGRYLFTHAGISHSFARTCLGDRYTQVVEHLINAADLLNAIHASPSQSILHTVSRYRGGYDQFGGITWADYRETSVDLLPGYHQIVGHTPVDAFARIGDSESSITYIDLREKTGFQNFLSFQIA